MRWKEEKVLLLEEMRRVVMFLRWKATWWMEHVDLRASTSIEVRMGLNAYAYKQVDLFLYIASTFINGWVPVLKNLGLPHENFESLESSGSFVPRRCSIARLFPRKSGKKAGAAAPAVSVQNSTPSTQTMRGSAPVRRRGGVIVLRTIPPEEAARMSRPHIGFLQPPLPEVVYPRDDAMSVDEGVAVDSDGDGFEGDDDSDLDM